MSSDGVGGSRDRDEREDERKRELFDSDLYWLFNESAGDLAFSAIPLEPSYGGNSDDPGINNRQLKTAGRCRFLMRALNALDHSQQAILRAAHTPMLPALRPLAGRLERPVDNKGCSVASVVFLLFGKDMIEHAIDLARAPRRVREALDQKAVEEAERFIKVARRTASAKLESALRAFWLEQSRGRHADAEVAKLRAMREKMKPAKPVPVVRTERVGKAGIWPAARREPDWARKKSAAV